MFKRNRMIGTSVSSVLEISSSNPIPFSGPIFYISTELKQWKDTLGRGRGSVGRVVTSDTRRPWFESSHQKILYWTFYCQLNWKDENKEKRGREWPKQKGVDAQFKLEIWNQPEDLFAYLHRKKLNLFLKCKRFRSDKKLSLKILRNFDNYVHRFVREFLRAASKIGLSF